MGNKLVEGRELGEGEPATGAGLGPVPGLGSALDDLHKGTMRDKIPYSQITNRRRAPAKKQGNYDQEKVELGSKIH